MALLFNQLVFYLPSTLSQIRLEQLSHLIETHGGTVTRSPEGATHVVTNSHRFEGWQAFEGDKSRPVCTVQWLERSALFGKLQPTLNYSPDPTMLFSGVVGCAADLRSSDVEILSGGISALGGQWRGSLTKDVTHLFTLGTDSEKYQQATDYKKGINNISIVLPHWFDDVMKLGMGNLDVAPYEWPDVIVLQPSHNDKEKLEASKKSHKLDAEKKSLYTTAIWNPDTASNKLAPKTVFGRRRVLLGATLDLGERRKAIESFVERADGIIVPLEVHDDKEDRQEEAAKVDDCDIFVCKYRYGPAYYKAARAGKTIASLAWLFHVITTGTLSAPLDQILHYPIPKKPVEGFSDEEITITNFTGETREYLKKLIITMGATFTPSMSAKNTVLIAAQNDGTKTDRARAWQIPIVNHLWLEDCFVEWKKITVGSERYIHFPKGSDFAPKLGERGLDRDIESAAELDRVEEEYLQEMEELATSTGEGLRTQDSARDAREAADIAMGMDDAMDIEVPKLSTPKTRIGSRAGKPRISGGDSDDDDDLSDLKPSKKKPTRLSGRPSPLKADDPMDLDSEITEKENERNGKRKIMSSKKQKKVQDPESEDDDMPQISTGKPKTAKVVRYVSSDSDQNDEKNARKGGGDRTTSSKKARGKAPRNLVESEDEDDEDMATPSKKTVAASKNRRRSSIESEESDDNAPQTPFKSPPKPKAGPSPKQLDSVAMPSLASVKINSSPPKVNGAGPSSGRRSNVLSKTESINLASSERPSHASSSRRNTGTTNVSVSPARPPLKRAAATKASQQLRDTVMPDLRSYEAEMKKRRRQSSSSSVLPRDKDQAEDDNDEEEEEEEEEKPIAGKGKKAKAQEEKSSGAGAKRKASSKDGPGAQSDAPAKKAKTKKRKPGSVRVLTTQVTLSDDIKKALEKLGAKIVNKPSECTHLIAARVARTEKFLCALAVAPWILTDKWVYDSVDAKALLPEEAYFLKDKGQWDIDLAKSLERAKESKHRLLENQLFYISPNVQLDRKLLHNVATAYGAKIQAGVPSGRQLIIPQRYLLTCEEDRPMWAPLAAKHHIYTVDVLLTGVLQQEMEWFNPKFHVKGSLEMKAVDDESMSEEA